MPSIPDPESILWTLLEIKDENGNPIILSNGDTVSISFDFVEAASSEKPKMVSAIFIGPSVSWCQARANDLNYERPDVQLIPFKRDLEWNFRGMRPNDDGEPIIYLTGLTEIMDGPIDTPDKRSLRNLLKRLELDEFEIINLDQTGMRG